MDGICSISADADTAASTADGAARRQSEHLAGHFCMQAGKLQATRRTDDAAPSIELDARISQFLSLTGKLVASDDCLFVLMDQGGAQPMRLVARSSECTPTASGCHACVQANQAAAREAIRAGKPLLHAPVRAAAAAVTNALPQRRNCSTLSIATSPIRIGQHVVGAVNLSRAGHRAGCGPADLDVIAAIAQLLAQTFQLNRLEQILSSQFAQLAIARQAGGQNNDAVLQAGADPERLARLLAKSFYREMTKLGLDSSQIIVAASEIISQLSGTVKRHRDRRGRTGPRGRTEPDVTATPST